MVEQVMKEFQLEMSERHIDPDLWCEFEYQWLIDNNYMEGR